MTFSHALSTNNYGCAKFIVDANAANGTHTTIASALTSASSGDTIFIRPGTYTENLTLKSGVNLTAYTCDASTNNTGHVIILGKCTMTTAGTVTISGIELQTNSDFFLAVTGSANSFVCLRDCFLNVSNNTGISYTSSGAFSAIQCYYCKGDIGTTGITLFTASGSGQIVFEWCRIDNSGLSSTSSTISSGAFISSFSIYGIPFTTSNTARISFDFSQILPDSANTTCLTHNGSGTSETMYSRFGTSGSASAISIGAGATLEGYELVIISTNANAITGAGTFNYSGIFFTSGITNAMNVSTTNQRNAFTGSISFDNGATYINQLMTTTSHGVCVFNGTNIVNLAAGSAGQVLQSGGASANPSYSTATYPTTAGTSGNVLTSDGTNWSSSSLPASSGLITVTGTLLNSQIKNLHATPIQLIAAQGLGKVIQIIAASSKLIYGGNNVFTAGASQTIALYWGAGATQSTWILTGNTTIVAAANTYHIAGGPSADRSFAATLLENIELRAFNPVATEISGNAANDNTISWSITYKVLSI